MSRLLRPVGPLAPHVYWLRRIMVVAIAAVLVFAATKVVVGILPDDPVNTSASDASTPRPAQTVAPPRDEESGPGGGSGSADGPTDTGSRGGREAGGSGTSAQSDEPGGGAGSGDAKGSEHSEPDVVETDAADSDDLDATNVSDEADPTAEARELPICLTQDLGISAVSSATEVEAGSTVKLTVELVNRTDGACRVEVNPITLQLQVVSGEDRVWTSAHCPVLIPTGPLTLQPDEPRPLSVDWPGTRSGPECAQDQPEAQPGYYQVQATLGELVSAPLDFRVS